MSLIEGVHAPIFCTDVQFLGCKQTQPLCIFHLCSVYACVCVEGGGGGGGGWRLDSLGECFAISSKVGGGTVCLFFFVLFLFCFFFCFFFLLLDGFTLDQYPCKMGSSLKAMWNEVYCKRKEFAPVGSKFFPFRVDLFFQRGSKKKKLTALPPLKVY